MTAATIAASGPPRRRDLAGRSPAAACRRAAERLRGHGPFRRSTFSFAFS
jgi:hypothetical protein